ncbi:MAG: hypothetical protein DMF90_06475 [Acidobacteria bacterium]|nr:MAG: hypothetical protein DMF90_06475 [Acidobacteriota bacterium]
MKPARLFLPGPRFADGQHPRDEAGQPRRHQVTELPPVAAHITEYRCHRRRCRECGRVTQAALPEDVTGQFGPASGVVGLEPKLR